MNTKLFKHLGFLACLFFVQSIKAQSYNSLFIPDTMSGTNFNLTVKDTFAQIVNSGNQSITGGINGKFWGPTIFINKWANVQMNVTNKLNDSTTLHWHGMHLPAVMDGGPHQVIPPNTVWQPYWTMKNDAGTYWYHPHLHMMTEEQIIKGIGGLLIVRDSVERALNLPRTYGVDDVPLVITDRKFNSSNQMSIVPYGDSVMVNMTLRPQYTVPAQVVRFRILNGAPERSYNLGFSDNRTFSVITSDGGLLAAPVALTRYLLHVGERIEILVNCTGQNGTAVDLKAYNSSLAQNVPGGDILPANTIFYNYLARVDFKILHLNIGIQTTNPITTVPAVLRTIIPIPTSNANITRSLTISDTNIVGVQGAAFILNHKLFDLNYNNYSVPLNNTEIWQITNSGNFGHPFHIHDVQFNILSVNGAAPAAAQAGWKDVVFVPASTGGGPPGNPGTPSVVKFIAKFEDYADVLHPFMFHCHITLHEDEGMMGQFIVSSNPTAIKNIANSSNYFSVYPNPSSHKLFVKFSNDGQSAYYVRIIDLLGRTILMLPRPELQNGIDISALQKGSYSILLTDNETKETTSKTFIVE